MCYRNEPAKLIYPKTKDAFIKFKNFKNKFRYLYVIYADFECILEDYVNLLCDENTINGAYKNILLVVMLIMLLISTLN